MEPTTRERWIRNLVMEWAGTAQELRDLARWCDDQADQMAHRNEDPIARPGRQVVEVHRRGALLLQLERKRCGKATCRCMQPAGQGHGPYWYAYWRAGGKTRSTYLGKQLRPEHFFAEGPADLIRPSDAGGTA